MTGNGVQMKPHEARRLLNLGMAGNLSSGEIEQAYKAAISFWSRKISDPLISHQERDRAHDMLKLLMQARDSLLASSTPFPAASSPPSAPQRRVPARASYRPSGNATRQAAGHLGAAFSHAARFFIELFRFVCALPEMLVEVKDFFVCFMDDMDVRGLPKPVMIVMAVLVLLLVLQGCCQIIGGMGHVFR
jgi:hypothetical protein